MQPICWVRLGTQEQIALPARHVDTHPAVARVLPSYGNKDRANRVFGREEGEGNGKGGERDDKEGDETGEQH